MEIFKDGVLRPMHSGLDLGRRVGGAVVQGMLHNSIAVPGRIIRTVDDVRLVNHLVRHHCASERRRLVEEIVEKREDFSLVDHNVVGFVHVSALHGHDMEQFGRQATEPYFEEITEIMTDKGLRELTVVKAVAYGRDVLPEYLTRHS